MRKYTIGIDFGTLSGRALLVDVETGEELATDVVEYSHGVMNESLPDGTPLKPDWNLQYPEDYLDVLRISIRNVMKKAGVSAGEVIGIGIDFTACTMLPIKKEGTPLCFEEKYSSHPNAYVKLWKHHSAQLYADRMTDIAIQSGETFLKRYGGRISSEWMFPKIWQTLDEDPEVYHATDLFIEASDWIVYILTGKLVRNTSSAGAKGMWDQRTGYPSKTYFKKLDPRLENIIEEKFYGDVLPVGTKAGEITKKAAELTGLLPGTAVSIGNLDAHGATIGSKIYQPGNMLIMMGTSSCHELICKEEKDVPGICGYVYGGIMPGYFGYEAGQSSVGDEFAWFVNNATPYEYKKKADAQGISIYDYLNSLASVKKVGETGLVSLDWWNGNRSILTNGNLSGMIVGYTLLTKPEDIYRALLESTAFGTRKIVEDFKVHGVPVDNIVISGGIAQKNPFAMQIYSDVLDCDIHISGSKQNAALSAAIWGAIAAGEKRGGYDRISEAAEAMGKLSATVYHPDIKNHELYNRLYEKYTVLHDYFGKENPNLMKDLKLMTEESMKSGRKKNA